MGKVSGSYQSVVRGVSQQAPQDCRSGQHEQQINMLSDPVRGLARRHGSVTQDEVVANGYYPDLLTDTAHHRAVSFHAGGVIYDLVIRTAPAAGRAGFAWAFDRSTTKFIPVVLAENDPVLDQLVSGGMSAAVNIGKYLFVAGNTITPTWTTVDRWGSADNQRYAAVWVRGGAYARTFSVTVTKTDGTKVTASYKTKTSSYPQVLDTSDLNSADTDYQKKVNDRVNAYNSAATAWIGAAATDITPQNIAQQLASQLSASGVAGVTVNSGTVTIEADGISDLTADDGGDDTLIHAVGNEVTAAELVSTIHQVGKVVKVRPKRSAGDDAFYLEAVAKDDGATGWQPVYWRECAGTVTTPTSAFVLATVVNGTVYMASSSDKLDGISGLTDAPAWKASTVGDELTTPVPYFLGKRIDYLGVFQDRLIIGSGSVLLFSRPGDYFNWFRQSVLTVLDDDPVEEYALGAEDDTITASATFDRDLVFFGARFWYSVTGAQPLTPKSNGVIIVREELDTNPVPPRAMGNLVFYCKQRGEPGRPRTRLHQMQAGLLADSPEGTDVSAALSDYLSGNPLDVVTIASPNVVFLRTDADRQALFVYTYMDSEQGGQRLYDAWSKWTWHPRTGALVAIARDGPDLLAYMLRFDGAQTWLACERFLLTATLSARPYMDCLRPLSTGGYALGPDACVAFDADSSQPFIGAPIAALDQLTAAFGTGSAWAGLPFEASVTPTNPYIRDQNDRAVINGRLTLSRVDISVVDTGALAVDVESLGQSRQVRDFRGRTLGARDNLLGQQPIVSTTIPALVGREVRDCTYTISAVDWLPLTVTGLQWSGQFFTNTRRV